LNLKLNKITLEYIQVIQLILNGNNKRVKLSHRSSRWLLKENFKVPLEINKQLSSFTESLSCDTKLNTELDLPMPKLAGIVIFSSAEHATRGHLKQKN
jgi:hypothetical protein